MENRTPNIHVIHSVWRRIKKGKICDPEVRDLEPTKDVKGGRSSGTDKSKSIGGGKGPTDRR